MAIVEPTDGATVDQEDTVRGTVSDPRAAVSLLLCPMPGNERRVKRQPDVGGDSEWATTGLFGAEDVGQGEPYESVALATLEDVLANLLTGNRLRPGDRRSHLPASSDKSAIAALVRAR